MILKPKVNYSISKESDYDKIERTGKALASKLRIKILAQVSDSPKTLTELAKINHITTSTAIFHTNILIEANLLQIRYQPGKKGKTQVFFTGHLEINIDYASNVEKVDQVHNQSIAIGDYTDANFHEYVRFATENEMYRIEKNDVFNSIRNQAGLIWTGGGQLTYSFSNQFAVENVIKELVISLELCSETFGYRNDWKSDITFSINDVELGTHTSLGDYGGIRGKLNPKWWSSGYTQYGDLISISISENGVAINKKIINKNITLKDLKLSEGNKLQFSIYTKKDSEHYGGFNIFGKNFGNYEQDILLTAIYAKKQENKLN